MATVMMRKRKLPLAGTDGVIVRPKRVHKQNIFIFAKDFACPRRARGRQECEERSEPDHFGVIFGVTLGSVWVSVGDFGSLDSHFTIIVESHWVYKGPFSKNIHFPNRFQ